VKLSDIVSFTIKDVQSNEERSDEGRLLFSLVFSCTTKAARRVVFDNSMLLGLACADSIYLSLTFRVMTSTDLSLILFRSERCSSVSLEQDLATVESESSVIAGCADSDNDLRFLHIFEIRRTLTLVSSGVLLRSRWCNFFRFSGRIETSESSVREVQPLRFSLVSCVTKI